jgi:riboflavin-specific deaminase-like protein
VGGIYENIRLPNQADREARKSTKPYVILNMVQSVDGRAAIEGKASGLGTQVDREVMRTLRSGADAVMVGGGTVRAERLSLGLDADDTRPVPRAVILTNSGDLPLERNLVRDRRQNLLVLLPDGAAKDAEKRLGRLAETRRVPATGSGAIDVGRALEIMKADYGMDVLLCEGGPTLNRALVSADLADELFITMAPVLVGTASSEDARSSLRKPLRLISSHAVGDEVFLRYATEKRR